MRVRARRVLLAVASVPFALLGGRALRALVLETEANARVAPRPPRPFILPGALAAGDDQIEVELRPADAARAPVGPTEAEDRWALFDPQRDFESTWRVLFVALDPVDRTAHGCILASRSVGEQIFLAPGQRLGASYVLLGIDPVPGSPRGARLRFSDLRRGVVVEVTLSPTP